MKGWRHATSDGGRNRLGRVAAFVALAAVVASGVANAGKPETVAPVTPTPKMSTTPDPLSGARKAMRRAAYDVVKSRVETALVTGLEGSVLGDAQHMLAIALFELKQPKAAAEVLKHALVAVKDGTATSVLMDELHFQRARALAAGGDAAGAISHFDAVIAHTRSPHRQDAALRKARILTAAAPTGSGEGLAAKGKKRLELALEAYEFHLKTWPGSPAARDVRLAMSRLMLALGDTRKARAQLQHLVDHGPQSRAGLAASLLLKKMGLPALSPFARLAAIEALTADRRFEQAVEPLEALRASAKERGDKGLERDVVKLLIRVFSEIRREADALALVPQLRKLGGRLPTTEQRIRWTALAGDYERAEKMLLARHNDNKNDYYWRRLGDMRFSFGKYKAAFKAYRKARGKKRSKVVDGEKVEDLSPKMAWSLIGMGKPERALWYLKQRRPKGKRNRQGAKYWVGRALQLSERKDEALAAYDALAAAAPYEYYGILAHSRALEMRGKAPARHAVADGIGSLLASTPEVSPKAAEEPGGDVASPDLSPSGTIFWNAASLDAKFDAAPKPKSFVKQRAALGKLVADWGELLPEAKRALAYLRRGLVDRARDELRVINSDLRAVRRNGAYSLLVRGRNDLLDNRRVGAARGGARLSAGKRQRPNKSAWTIAKNRKAIRTDLRTAQVSLADPYALRRQAFETSRIPRTDANVALWRRVYPVAYPKLVSTFSDLHGVPAYFLYGIMTVESTFHPCAVSVANAYGLLQVIPRTGRRIASSLGYTEFVPDLLLKPEVSIYFGSFYLGQLLQKFRGQELLAAAAYNAGPHRVDRWLRQNPNRDMDLFVEQIPYGQTKGYARSVLEKVARYRRTYHGEKRLYVSNRLATDSRLQPNY